jgi:hypothetical protein
MEVQSCGCMCLWSIVALPERDTILNLRVVQVCWHFFFCTFLALADPIACCARDPPPSVAFEAHKF